MGRGFNRAGTWRSQQNGGAGGLRVLLREPEQAGHAQVQDQYLGRGLVANKEFTGRTESGRRPAGRRQGEARRAEGQAPAATVGIWVHRGGA